MSEEKLEQIAEEAQMIVAGFAFTKSDDGFIRVLNLNNPEEACVLDQEGMMIETTMDDHALTMTRGYYLRNREFMEDDNA